MIEFRYAIGADAALSVKDFKLKSTYAAVAKKGDIVKLDASGEVVAAAAADAAVLGVYVGPCIKMEKDTDTFGKVITAEEAVFEVTVSGGTPVVGTAYQIGLTGGDYFLNAGATATPALKVVAVRPNGNADVIISGRQI